MSKRNINKKVDSSESEESDLVKGFNVRKLSYLIIFLVLTSIFTLEINDIKRLTFKITYTAMTFIE